MAQYYDEYNRKPRQPSAAYQQRQARIRRAKILRWVTFLSVAAVCCLVIGVLIFRGGKDPSAGGSAATLPPQTTTQAPTQTTAPTEPTEPETVINLVFGGDVNVTDRVVASGEDSGRYDYTNVFMDATSVLANADATFINLEGGFYGSPFGAGTASAPQELADALAAAGVDMVQLANSYTIFDGLTGLSSTADSIRLAGMIPVGVFSSGEEYAEKRGIMLVDIGGIRVAIVAFTKGMDGMSLPAGSENCVNLLYKDYATTYHDVNEEGIRAVLQAAAAQKPDLTIALVHWGSEYNDSISPSQKAIAQIMVDEGVDAIVGTHSHFVQQIDYDENAGTVVAYSLGDLYGNAEKAGTNYSILLQLQVTRDNRTGETRITGCDYTGLYVLTPEKDNEPMRIVRILSAMDMYEHNHVSKVSAVAYENMKYAWQRIQARIAGE